MSKILFSIEQIKILKANLYVNNVSAKGITYTEEFREQVAIRL